MNANWMKSIKTDCLQFASFCLLKTFFAFHRHEQYKQWTIRDSQKCDKRSHVRSARWWFFEPNSSLSRFRLAHGFHRPRAFVNVEAYLMALRQLSIPQIGFVTGWAWHEVFERFAKLISKLSKLPKPIRVEFRDARWINSGWMRRLGAEF